MVIKPRRQGLLLVLACATIFSLGTPIKAQPPLRGASLAADDNAAHSDPAAGRTTEIWTCTFPDFAKPSDLYTEQFLVIGDELLENDFFQLHFKILQNTEYGLVAAWSIAGMETNFPSKKTPTIGAMTMVINRATGDLLRSGTAFDIPDKAVTSVRGTCKRSKPKTAPEGGR